MGDDVLSIIPIIDNIFQYYISNLEYNTIIFKIIYYIYT